MSLTKATYSMIEGALSNVIDLGADATGTANSLTAFQSAGANTSSVYVPDGTYTVSANIPLTAPKSFTGNGTKTLVRTSVGFGAAPIFTLSPTSATDPKNWTVSNFGVTNQGSATSVFKIDLDAAGKYISKLTLSKIVSNTAVSTNRFVELTNVLPNIDGFFTSVIEDNWSFGGYYLDNVGDSVVLQRNTTTGAGIGYYVNQLGTAANIAIRDGNCTCTGGALRVVKGSNIIFDGMQVECPAAFTGVDNALIAINHASSLVFNTKITNCSINTQDNVNYCVYVQNADLTIIDGCNLYCNPATGAHIYIDSGARNTVIGNNKYFNALTGAEIDPVITDNGTGTSGVWKDATITLAGWSSQNTANEHPLGFFKDRDGSVQLRGRVAGAAIVGGETLFTLPVGFRPKTKGYLIGTYGAAGGANAVVIQIIPAGSVQILTANATGAYMAGLVFSVK